MEKDKGYFGFEDGTPINGQQNLHLDGNVDLKTNIGPISDLAIHERNQHEAMPGAVFGPEQNDKVLTNIKEAFGQLNNKNVFYFRAIYPGDIISDRHEIIIPVPASRIAKAHMSDKAPRWFMTNISNLPSVIKDHHFLSEVGIYGRVDTTGEIKRYFLRDGAMHSETVTKHPATGLPVLPGEIIRCGTLAKGWNIPRDEAGNINISALVDLLPEKERDAIKQRGIQTVTQQEITTFVDKLSERGVLGTMFTSRKNADPNKFYKVRDLDMVVDYEDPEIKKELDYFLNNREEMFEKENEKIKQKNEQLKKEGKKPKRLFSEEDFKNDVKFNEVKTNNYGKWGKIVIGGNPEKPQNIEMPNFRQDQYDFVQRIKAGNPNDPRYADSDNMTSVHSREELEAFFKGHLSPEDLNANKFQFWNQKYKYAHYFAPNAEMVVDAENGGFRPSKTGDKCVAYDPATRNVYYKHNHGTISLSSERNRNSSPPYLARKSMFYLHNPNVVSYMLEFVSGKMNLDAQNPGDCDYFNDAREIAKYIESVDIGGGAIEPDGTPVFKAAFSRARMYGDLYSTTKRMVPLVGGSALSSVVGAAAIGAVTQFATVGLTTAAIAGLTLPAVAATGLGAVAVFSLASGYFAKNRKFGFTQYEKDFQTDLYRSALKDHGITGFVDIKDELVGLARAICGLVYTDLLKNNTVEQQLETVSYTALGIAGAAAIGVVAGLAMGASVPLLAGITMAGATLATAGGLGLGVAKMGEIGERHFKHIYFYESSKMTETEAIMKGRPNDQYTRVVPSDHKKRNHLIAEHAKLFEHDIALPSETPKRPKKKEGLTLVANKDSLGALSKMKEHSPTLAV